VKRSFTNTVADCAASSQFVASSNRSLCGKKVVGAKEIQNQPARKAGAPNVQRGAENLLELKDVGY
jgi:hypothetical protein